VNEGLLAVGRQRARRNGRYPERTASGYFVLDTALHEFADRGRAEAQDAEDDSFGTAETRRRWAKTAVRMRAKIDAALN
jgi:hypothetical protein